MSPPQLARDAPVLNVVQPLVVGVDPVLGMELDLAGSDTFQRLLGDALAVVTGFAHGDEPLVGEHRFDDHAGAVAARYFEFVLLGFLEHACGFEIGDDLFACNETIQALILLGRMFVDLCIQCEDGDHLQLVTLSHRIVVEVMRRSDFHHAGAEFLVHIFVGDDGDVAVAQRQFHLLADEVFVALVFRMHHHRHVAEHGLGAGGGDGEMSQSVHAVRLASG